jgi:hypothetical protein
MEIGSNGEHDRPTKFAVLGGICGQKKAKEKVTQGCRLYAKWRNGGDFGSLRVLAPKTIRWRDNLVAEVREWRFRRISLASPISAMASAGN